MHGKKVFGTITAERVYLNRRLLKQDVELLTTIASMIAPGGRAVPDGERREGPAREREQPPQGRAEATFKPSNIIGNSKPMKEVYDLIDKVACTKATVLILGESGVGKELVASAIHYNGQSAEGPFIKFNCAALPESSSKASCSATRRARSPAPPATRKGRFERPTAARSFSTRWASFSLPVQAKLLRVLQERNFERVGGNKPIKVDVRIIAATNRNLIELIEKGSSARTCIYRLNVFPITIPPLRERGSDVILLADHFVSAVRASRPARNVKRISTPALNMLMATTGPAMSASWRTSSSAR